MLCWLIVWLRVEVCQSATWSASYWTHYMVWLWGVRCERLPELLSAKSHCVIHNTANGDKRWLMPKSLLWFLLFLINAAHDSGSWSPGENRKRPQHPTNFEEAAKRHASIWTSNARRRQHRLPVERTAIIQEARWQCPVKRVQRSTHQLQSRLLSLCDKKKTVVETQEGLWHIIRL